MAEIIKTTDLPAKLQAAELIDDMVAGANAQASRVAPCLVVAVDAEAAATPEQLDQLAEAKLVLFGAVKRWADAGAGALQSQTAGPFGMTLDTRQRTGFNLWPSEIKHLQDVCKGAAEQGKAYGVDMAPTVGLAAHMPWCSLFFGGMTCSCGVALTGGDPIYEPAD